MYLKQIVPVTFNSSSFSFSTQFLGHATLSALLLQVIVKLFD